MCICIEYILQEFHGMWEEVRRFDSKKEALEELEFYRKNFPEQYRVVEQRCKVLWERN